MDCAGRPCHISGSIGATISSHYAVPDADAMLSDADRAFFAEHGWVVARGAVAPARIAELEAALAAAVPPIMYPHWGERFVEIALQPKVIRSFFFSFRE